MRKELKARTCKQESWSNIIVTCWLPLCVLFFSKVFYMIQDQEKFKDPLVQKLQSLIKVLNFCVVSYLSSSLFSFPFISLKLWNRVPLLKDYFCYFYFFYWKSFLWWGGVVSNFYLVLAIMTIALLKLIFVGII